MTPEIGHFALALALAMAIVQSVLPILGAARGNILWMQSAKWSSLGQVFFASIAFFALLQAEIQEQERCEMKTAQPPETIHQHGRKGPTLHYRGRGHQGYKLRLVSDKDKS